jgi:hypothetical protein
MTPTEMLRQLRETVDSLDTDAPSDLSRIHRIEEAATYLEDLFTTLASLDDSDATTGQVALINDAGSLIAKLARVVGDIADREGCRYPARRSSIEDEMTASKRYREVYGDDTEAA